MHPQVIQPAPGICPICHMELTPLKSDGAGGGTVNIDPVIVQNMGVRTAEVQKGPIVQSVRVVGYLEEPEPLHRDINLRVNGWIEKLYANVDGMLIKDGQPLFDLYSPELTVAIDEMISAAKQLKIAPEDETSKALIDASRRKLLQYGLTDGQVTELGKLDAAPRTVPIIAPIGGHLTAKMVYEGAAVKAGDLVLRLASRHRIWIDAQVPEQQMPLLSDGQPVRATLVSQPGKVFDGKLLFVHPHLDPKTRTALARIEIDNPDLHLRQGMYATVEIAADDYREATVVPREAVIDSGRRQLAFVDLGGGRFEPRDLKLGLSGQDDTVEVLEGGQTGRAGRDVRSIPSRQREPDEGSRR
ncbi:MAG TPA: efflux RND transporter periplasmic adaptor subunit [Tepidisphaeraceae bacterium]|jgi:RND family efflux transporter MFP subunit|nr:efflux RND transporter periplasmic adaptor subunit [Tepidisphaeraceae bacterium]